MRRSSSAVLGAGLGALLALTPPAAPAQAGGGLPFPDVECAPPGEGSFAAPAGLVASAPVALLAMSNRLGKVCLDLSSRIRIADEGQYQLTVNRYFGIDGSFVTSVYAGALFGDDGFIDFAAKTRQSHGIATTYALLLDTRIAAGTCNASTSGISGTAWGIAEFVGAHVLNNALSPTFVTGYGARGASTFDLGLGVGDMERLRGEMRRPRRISRTVPALQTSTLFSAESPAAPPRASARTRLPN